MDPSEAEFYQIRPGGAPGSPLCLHVFVAERRLGRRAKQRQLAGSRRGSELVQTAFASAITRRHYCELVGIHPTTLRKWERQGLVKPQMAMIMRSPTRIFTEEDVAFGQRLIELLRSRRGEISIEQAAAMARRSR